MKVQTVLTALAMLVSVPLATGTGKVRPAEVIDVSTLMREAKKHKGAVRVEGIVSRVYPKDQKLGLIDTAEFKRCGVVTCADLVLPVRWAGAMPEPKTHVRLKRQIRKQDGRMEFIAESLEKVAVQ